MAVAITAGATRNPIDAVRYISATSSGRTGVAVANGLMERGVAVWLLASPEARLRAPDVPGEGYGSTRDLMAKMEAWVRDNPRGGLVHACAVGDYEATETADKVPSGLDRWELALTPTPKIADQVRGWGLTGPYVTFKAAPPNTSFDDLRDLARRQRERTGCDLVFANVLGRLSEGVLLVGDGQVQAFARRDEAVRSLIGWLGRRVSAASV